MTSREQRRFRLRAALGEQLGDEVAEDLMDSLPPFDWTQIATKDDIKRLELRFDATDQRFVSMNHHLDGIDHRLDRVDQRFEMIDQRFEMIDQRFEVIDKRFDLVDQRFDLLESKIGAKMLRMTIGSTITSVGVLAGLMALLR